MKAAIQHRGFALLDILQVCFTFNHEQTFQFYRDRVYKLKDEGHDATDLHQAWTRAQEWGDRIPIGRFYQEERPIYRDSLHQLKKQPLIKQPIRPRGLEKLVKEFI
jgi:2-oxoglutarate ferredoxin oxidoreductase subunit beta